MTQIGTVNAMRVRRGLLFWGLLLIPLGAIPLLARSGAIDVTRLADAWRLWPLVVIGIGLAILASRTRYAIVGTIVIALSLGTIGGAALAGGGFWLGAVGGCGFGSNTTQQVDQSGAFGSLAQVRLELDCGSIDFRAGGDSGWTVHAAYRGDPPQIQGEPNRLSVGTPSGGDRRQDWTIAVPATQLGALDMTVNAATSTVDLGTAALSRLRADANAGDLRVTAGSATIEQLDLSMNAGRVRVTLGSSATSGSLSVNAGAIDLCVPAEAGLRLNVEDQLTFATNLSSRGLTRDGNTWTRAATGSAGTIELSVDGNAATFNLDPTGGC
jgi:hypothetical protein